jgi:hypothetical protein
LIAYQDSGSAAGREFSSTRQATLKILTRIETAVYATILDHYKLHERRDAFPGYERIADAGEVLRRRTAIPCVLSLEYKGVRRCGSGDSVLSIVGTADTPTSTARTSTKLRCPGAPRRASPARAERQSASETDLDAPALRRRTGDHTELIAPRPMLARPHARPTAPRRQVRVATECFGAERALAPACVCKPTG